MNIAYFSNQFASKSGHGIARYARNLYEQLAKLGSDNRIIPVAAWSNCEPGDLKKLKHETGLHILKTGRKMTPAMWVYLGFPAIEQIMDEQIDIVHAVSLGYTLRTKKKYVVTVHDIGPLTHPEYFEKFNQHTMKASLKHAVKKASAFICVSNATASELEYYVKRRLNQNISSRIEVVYEGVSDFFSKPHELKLNNTVLGFDPENTPFILSVGKISPRKNLIGVIKAMYKIKDQMPHHLVTVGGDGWDFRETKKLAQEMGLQNRIHFLGYVSDELLRALYQQASVFVYPSLFEGFGLTILEAMSAGCPVITSNGSSLPEVAGNASMLVNPQDQRGLAEAIMQITSNESLKEDFVNKGRINLNRFSWAACAEKIDDMYTQLM